MQNKWYSSDEAGYVALNGGWQCPRCGCANEGCDVCSRCGWNMAGGCGCQGGVVAANQLTGRQAKYGCDAAQNRQNTGWQCTRCGCANEGCGACARCGCLCEQNGGSQADAVPVEQSCGEGTGRQRRCSLCPAESGMTHGVQCCPANTALRPAASSCGCVPAAVPASAGCTRNTEKSCGYERAAEKCGCAETAVGASAVRRRECPAAAGVGMVNAVKQELGNVYQSESALRTGTLFPELHKPMNGRCPGRCNSSTPAQQSSFAAWDLRLYLDTHPNDEAARALFCQLSQETEEPCYATTFLNGGAGWGWTDEPWPWDCRANDE